MLKNLLKRNFVYSIYKKNKGRRLNKSLLLEIEKRIADNTLLKDLNEDELQEWSQRIALVLSSSDNEKINCVENAGTLKDGLLVMHNGIVIEPLSYYGYPILQMLLNNRGIHEPQEEYVFQEVLKEIPDGATMLEIGAYWSFYSMWFNKNIKNAKNYMIEPCNIDYGKTNFKSNRLKGNFFQYYIADKPSINENGSVNISVDSFIKDNNIDFVDILHSDIQGYELLMLKGAHNLLTKRKVGYVFISTHSDDLHADCQGLMNDMGFIRLCSANLQETFSQDGLLVYKNPEYKGIEKIEISLRKI
jgi:Methyltransferase FkbM domain